MSGRGGEGRRRGEAKLRGGRTLKKEEEKGGRWEMSKGGKEGEGERKEEEGNKGGREEKKTLHNIISHLVKVRVCG